MSKTILIVGTSTGIGEASVKLLSEKGYTVIATTRDPAKADHLAKLPNVHVVKMDILNYEEVEKTCAQLQKDYNIDICFSNAGMGVTAPVEKESMETLRKLYDLNFFGTVNLIKQFIPYFKAKKSGMFMVTSSVAGVFAISLQSAYGSAKRALNAFCESLYYELKPYNISVKIIIPAYTKTAFKDMFTDKGEYKKSYKKQGLFMTDNFSYAAESSEIAETVLTAITDGKDQIHYPADKECQKLVEQYNKMGLEDFKKLFYEKVFAEGP